MKLANIYFYEEDIHKVLVREGIEPEDYDQIPPGPPHAQIPPPYGQIPPPHGQAPPPNLPNEPQVQNMGKDDDEEEEDDEDIRKKIIRSIILYNLSKLKSPTCRKIKISIK